ncbi:hypothetical protein RJ639_044657 [Escallonia herrerae]|uniref:RING-type domain-containing protein n=1 Tax=Escallonia herrerae TaxID=1293975 RepID=A0AA88WE27_9ASTE|nr:hypothetical protein RJ639_044657 [Escallonia herrerae]
MTTINEDMHVSAVHVYRADADSPLEDAEGEAFGYFVFHVTSKTKNINPTKNCKVTSRSSVKRKPVSFDLTMLLPPIELKDLAFNVADNCGLFSAEACEVLSTETSNKLAGFHFEIETLAGWSPPKIIIVVEVQKSSTVTSDEDAYEAEESCGFEPDDMEFMIGCLDGYNEVPALMEVKKWDHLSDDGCPICLSKFLVGMEVAKPHCLHSFHKDCIFKWLSKSNSCPMCRSICITSI